MNEASDGLWYEDHYFSDEEEALEHYFDVPASEIPETLVPDMIAPLSTVVDTTKLAECMMEHIINGDFGMEPLATEDDSFDQWSGATVGSLKTALDGWLDQFPGMHMRDEESPPIQFKAKALAYQQDK